MWLRALVIGFGAALAACGSSAPATPSTPSPSAQTITVKGTATLTVGQVVQFTATTNTGQDVTGQSIWRTSDTAVRISTPGLVTALRTGTATIDATYRILTATLSVQINPALISASPVTSCGNIVAPGDYVLANDIAIPIAAGACLNILASGVHLDCRNHTLTGMLVSNADNVVVTNCTFVAEAFLSAQSYATVRDSTHVTFDHNRMSTIDLSGGHDNRVLQNTIDGGYDGSGRQVGQDDGVILSNEANDTVEGNTIRNVFDAGIEGVDLVMNTVIANNTIENAAVAGIGSYWCTSWTGNTVSGNTVSRSQYLALFHYSVGLSKCRSPATVGAFAGNRILGNRFLSPLPGGLGAMNFDFPNLPATAVSGNVIQGNDLGALPGNGPFAVPASGFINGGGNICAPFSENPFCG